MDPITEIKHIYIQREIRNHPKTRRIIDKLNCSISYIDEISDVPSHYFDKKKSLILASQQGDFIKECPCTPHYLGCKYHVVELAVGCLYDCTYCYLQQYQNIFATTFYVNFEDMYREFEQLLASDPDRIFRVGFGEYADSLFLDDILNYTQEISKHLSQMKSQNYLIEYKTKSNNINNLLRFKPTGHEVVGWSLNAQTISENEEKFAGNIVNRLTAMKKCVNQGYFVAVHFDPLVYFDGWEVEYLNIINQLFDNIDKKRILWISIGSLRFNPGLKPIIEYRHPESKIVATELIKGVDNKMRYPKVIRKKLYSQIVDFIKKRDPSAFIYFCMEDKDIWLDVLGKQVEEDEDIGMLFKKQVMKCFK
ncbi:MAG: hypothetical protein GY817_08280 [bacterium]|nr:hypothetical protein [bacterium]